MSIERYLDYYVPACDVCGGELEWYYGFNEAVAAKKDAGWRSRKNAAGGWEDVCPECQKVELLLTFYGEGAGK